MTRLEEIKETGGFEFEDSFITDPWMDETCRFEVDPIAYYDLTEEELDQF